jgi:hypothetical protein
MVRLPEAMAYRYNQATVSLQTLENVRAVDHSETRQPHPSWFGIIFVAHYTACETLS